MPMSTMTAFRNRIEPRSMNHPRLAGRRGIPYLMVIYRLSIYFYRYLACQPTPRGWGRHQAGGVLGQVRSEGESAVGSMLALTRAPTSCRRRHSCLDGVEVATPHDVAGARRGYRSGCRMVATSSTTTLSS